MCHFRILVPWIYGGLLPVSVLLPFSCYCISDAKYILTLPVRYYQVCPVVSSCRFGITRLETLSEHWRVTQTRCRTSPLIRLESCWLPALRIWPSNSGTSRALNASEPCMVNWAKVCYNILPTVLLHRCLDWPLTHCVPQPPPTHALSLLRSLLVS